MAQCFLTLNVYGRSPEDVPTIVRAFDVVLEEFEIEFISLAFQEWMKSSPDMPTPSDIYKSCSKLENDFYQKQRSEFVMSIFLGNDDETV